MIEINNFSRINILFNIFKCRTMLALILLTARTGGFIWNYLPASTDCLYYKLMDLNTKYYVYSPNYPAHINARVKCNWRAVTIPGSKIYLYCDVIQLYSEDNCRSQQLKVFGNGRNNPSYIHIFCGHGTFSVTSEQNEMEIDFTSSINYGRFYCTIQAVELKMSNSFSASDTFVTKISHQETSTAHPQALLTDATSEIFQDPLFITTHKENVFFEKSTIEGKANSTTDSINLLTSSITTYANVMEIPALKNGSAGCTCGIKKNDRLLNGVATKVNEYPFMAALINSSRNLYCGATIIGHRYLITAAHCVADVPTYVLVGDHDITSSHETNSSMLYLISSIYIHEHYRKNHWENDIGIVKTTRSIKFSSSVMPACLPFKYHVDDIIGKSVTALGWGSTANNSAMSTVLRKINLKVEPNSFCKTFLNVELNKNYMCTFAMNDGPCKDDSGGPLCYEDQNNRIFLMGVILNNKTGCTISKPNYNILIIQYLDWIARNTQNENYCRL